MRRQQALALRSVRQLLMALAAVLIGSASSSVAISRWIVLWTREAQGSRLTASICGPEFMALQRNGSSATSANLRQPRLDINCSHVFSALTSGFAGDFGPGALHALKVQYKGSIASVERETVFELGDELWPANSTHGRRLAIQLDPTWGLDAIDQRALPFDHEFHYDSQGTGVHVYVLDTGILSTHVEFLTASGGGAGVQPSRVIRPGFSAFGTSTDDCHGHGTHVAAVVGGLTYGVAKNVFLHPVQVCDCSGTPTDITITKGLEWVWQNLQRPAIIHMSLQGPFSVLLNTAVEELIRRSSVPVVVSAGNWGVDACTISPGSASGTLTVAAVGDDYRRMFDGNWGTCVDIHAPGVNILSAVIRPDGSNTATALKTGTSMAAPFVTGTIATYLQGSSGASGEEVAEKLYVSSTLGVVLEGFPPGYNPALGRKLGSAVSSDAHISGTNNASTPLPTNKTSDSSAPPSTQTSQGHQEGSDAVPSDAPSTSLLPDLSPPLTLVSDPNNTSDPGPTLLPDPYPPIALALDTAPSSAGRQLASIALRGDKANELTWTGALVRGTPNRMLYSLVRPQALFKPSLLTVQSTGGTTSLTMVLTQSPTAPVTVTLEVPLAWDGKPLITVTPATFTLPAGATPTSTPPEMNLQLVAGSISAGSFFITAQLASADPFFDAMSQAFRVTDTRPQTGDTTEDPRVVVSLPFVDAGDSRVFTSLYGFDLGTGSGGGTNPGTLMSGGLGDGPDVVYEYTWTGPHPQPVTISTCGSSFDTVLALTSEGQRLFQTNDDDPGCASRPTNSRIEATLVPDASYFIVLKGFSGAGGMYRLSITAAASTATA